MMECSLNVHQDAVEFSIHRNNIDGFLSVDGMRYLMVVKLEAFLEYFGID